MAPAWMQARGLEWLYRLTREPGRLWRRYLILNPHYCWLLLQQVLKIHGGSTRTSCGGSDRAGQLRVRGSRRPSLQPRSTAE